MKLLTLNVNVSCYNFAHHYLSQDKSYLLFIWNVCLKNLFFFYLIR